MKNIRISAKQCAENRKDRKSDEYLSAKSDLLSREDVLSTNVVKYEYE